MFKHTFITLTVSLLVIGLLSVFQPQSDIQTEETTHPEVALHSEIGHIDFKEDVVLNSMDNITRKERVQEQEESKEEVVTKEQEQSESKPTTKAPVQKSKPVVKAPVQESKPVEKAPEEEVKADTNQESEQPKEEVASEPKEEPKEEVKPEPAPSKVSSTPAATWELEIARLTNIEREKAGLSILRYNTSLEAGALIRANEIIDHFSHTRPDGTRFFTAFGNISYRNIGENLANGFRSPSSVMSGWMSSDSHRANILKPEYEEISVAIVQGADGKYRWVQIFYRGR